MRVFLKEAPHHCLQQALRDLVGAYAKFFAGEAAYPKPKRKRDGLSFRFPDPAQFWQAIDALAALLNRRLCVPAAGVRRLHSSRDAGARSNRSLSQLSALDASI
jgi:putative transposase